VGAAGGGAPGRPAPPRGEQLRWLANASLLCGALAFLVAPALIGLPLGVAVGVLAERDLTRVDRGAAPADGREDLRVALGRAALGASLSALGLGFCGVLLLGFVTRGHL
jgi:hypothetical protein